MSEQYEAVAIHEHTFGESASVAAPGQTGAKRLFIYVASCECGAVAVGTQSDNLAIVNARRAAELTEVV